MLVIYDQFITVLSSMGSVKYVFVCIIPKEIVWLYYTWLTPHYGSVHWKTTKNCKLITHCICTYVHIWTNISFKLKTGFSNLQYINFAQISGSMNLQENELSFREYTKLLICYGISKTEVIYDEHSIGNGNRDHKTSSKRWRSDRFI